MHRNRAASFDKLGKRVCLMRKAHYCKQEGLNVNGAGLELDAESQGLSKTSELGQLSQPAIDRLLGSPYRKTQAAQPASNSGSHVSGYRSNDDRSNRRGNRGDRYDGDGGLGSGPRHLLNVETGLVISHNCQFILATTRVQNAMG
jgi:hypothetical protein